MKLSNALTLLSKVVSHRSSLPILEGVIVENGKLSGTDLETWIEVQCDVKIDAPAVISLKQLKAMAKGRTSLSLCSVDGGMVTDGSITIPVFKRDDFPVKPGYNSMEELGTFIVPATLPDVARAMSQDASRLSLCSVCFALENHHVVASDGKRMHYTTIDSTGKGEALVGLDVVKVLEKMPGGRAIVYSAKQNELAVKYVLADTDDVHIITRCVDASFPDYMRVIPQTTRCWQTNREALLAVCKGAQAVTIDRKRGIKLTGTSEGFVVEANTKDVGQYKATVKGAGTVNGVVIGVDVNYLLCALEAQGKADLVTLHTCEPNEKTGLIDNAMLLNGGEVQTVLMPCTVVK